MAKVTKDTMIGELLQIDENVAPMLLNIVCIDLAAIIPDGDYAEAARFMESTR